VGGGRGESIPKEVRCVHTYSIHTAYNTDGHPTCPVEDKSTRVENIQARLCLDEVRMGGCGFRKRKRA
jgi:hypothetical protein